MRLFLMCFFWSASAFVAAALITQPISVQAQLCVAIAGISICLAIYLLRLKGIWRSVFLATATAVILRYAYWRTTTTLPSTDHLVNFIPAIILYIAEMYCLLMLAMSLFVVADPIERKRARQLADGDLPTVDVFVPSYNEGADILSLTLAAAKAMDYPEDRLNIYLLDDGGTDQKRGSTDPAAAAAANRRHVELQALCAELGVHYRTRPANLRAKAGNLNSGLAGTHGDLVVVFDADHAPAREFLRETVGHLTTIRAFSSCRRRTSSPTPIRSSAISGPSRRCPPRT